MRSFRSILEASRRILASRLDHFRETLESLTERIRTTVAKVIGDNVGEVVCQTPQQILETNSTIPRPERPCGYDAWEDRSEPSSWWHEEEQPGYGNYRYSRPDFGESYPNNVEQPLESKPSRRCQITTAVAAGLRAAAWWIRHWCGRFAVWGAATVGVIAAGTSFVLESVTNAGLTVLETTDQVSTLKNNAPCRRRPSGFIKPSHQIQFDSRKQKLARIATP